MERCLSPENSKIAFICGIAGQDGAYLASFLLSKGYVVYGSTRKLPLPNVNNLVRLGIEKEVSLVELDPTCIEAVNEIVKAVAPLEVYNLTGQTSVGESFKYPLETWRSIEVVVINWLEAIRNNSPHIRFFNAGSSESFGNALGPINEQTTMTPLSPYAAAKAAAHWCVSVYRKSYGLHASTGFLFNHESSLREGRFVTRKIIDGVKCIMDGSKSQLILGNLEVRRDWGWAPDFVEAMWCMLQQSIPGDYVFATGRSVSLEYFIERAFSYVGLDWREHVLSKEEFVRSSDVIKIEADPSRIWNELGWRAKHSVEDVVDLMMAEVL